MITYLDKNTGCSF